MQLVSGTIAQTISAKNRFTILAIKCAKALHFHCKFDDSHKTSHIWFMPYTGLRVQQCPTFTGHKYATSIEKTFICHMRTDYVYLLCIFYMQKQIVILQKGAIKCLLHFDARYIITDLSTFRWRVIKLRFQ